MASRLFFNGRSTSTPTTQSVINDSAMAPTSLTVGNVLAILGASTGGQPNMALRFGGPDEVDAVLVDGPLRYAVKKAFAPSAETNAPSLVIAMRVGSATPATLTLVDALGNPAIVLTSVQYGLPANLTKLKVETGTALGKLLTTQLGQAYYSQDNVGRNAFSVSYSGGAASGQITVTDTQVLLLAPAGTIVGTISLTDCVSVAQLTDRISAVPGFFAAPIGGSDTTPVLNALDSVTALDVKTQPGTVTAHLQACIEWLNGLGQSFVTAARAPAAVLPPANVPFTFLAGGSNPAVLMSDWTNALAALQAEDVQWVAPLSGDPAVHAATDAHCSYMSVIGRKERRALCGPAAGTSLAAVQALPLALNSDRSSIVWPGYYDFNNAGVLTLYDPFYAAALVGAMFAGSAPGTPMTNKTMSVQGLETVIRNPTDTDPLIQSGVLCLERTLGGFKVVRSISTWLASDNFNRVEVSTGAATDFVARNVRDAVDPLRGGEAAPIAISRAISQAESALRELARPQPEGPGVIVGDDNSPAYQNITASIQGDRLSVEFQCSPVIPLNFITVAISVVPYSGTATVVT